MCGSTEKVEVHHVRKLKDINKSGKRKKPLWVRNMVAMRRKTMICCYTCHKAIHKGQYLKQWDELENLLESRVQ